MLVKPGWLAIYGKEAQDETKDGDDKSGANLVPVQPGEKVLTDAVNAKGLQTRPPARYSEATLLGAMEGAGKTIEDDELRAAMHEKGLGTPATRSSIIEGLIVEKYMLREGRELIPTAKAFQLMTLLRGLGVEELSKAELTGEWEYKLAQMEHGKLSRASFMAEIAAMTERMVKKAKEYDRDTIPGDYATLTAPCPNCGGVIKENYRRYTCTGKPGASRGLRLLVRQDAGRAHLRSGRGRAVPARQQNRSAGGFPLQGGLAVHRRDGDQVRRGDQELQARIRLRRRQEGRGKWRADRLLAARNRSAPAPSAALRCTSTARATSAKSQCPHTRKPHQAATSRVARSFCSKPVRREQMGKLLASGKTDLLDKFVSMRTRRPFKAMLAWDAEADKVGFEFAPSKFPPRKTAAGAAAAESTGAKAPRSARRRRKRPRRPGRRLSRRPPRRSRPNPRHPRSVPCNPVPHWPP